MWPVNDIWGIDMAHVTRRGSVCDSLYPRTCRDGPLQRHAGRRRESTDTVSDRRRHPPRPAAPADDHRGRATTRRAGRRPTAPSDTAGRRRTTAPAEVEEGERLAPTSAGRARHTASTRSDRLLQPAGGAVEVTHTNIDGVNEAIQYVNEEAGGIGGHPLEVVTCYVANAEEEGQQCGQQFANDDSIVAVISGPTFIGTEPFYAALAGSKPVIHGVSVSPADTVQDTAAVLFGGAKYILAPYRRSPATCWAPSRRRDLSRGAGQDEGAEGQRRIRAQVSDRGGVVPGRHA